LSGEARLFDGAHLRASMFATGGESGLVVTFRHRLSEAQDFSPANPLGRARAAGMAHLYLQSRANDWFINPETRALEAALAPLARRHARRLAIGFSMGGYGALRFAGVLGFQQVLLISPQVSIDPAQVPWDPRYREDAAGFDPDLGDLARRAVPGLRGLLIFDPFRPLDARHADRIAALFPGLDRTRFALGGHPATRVLGQGAGVGPLAARLIDGGLARAEALALHRRARRSSELYRIKLAQMLSARAARGRG
jgi:hypothetical protein